MKRYSLHRRRSTRGMTLIELLVAMVVMTIGIVGLVSLMARASQATASVEDSQRAALLASDLANDMWAYGVLNPPTTAAWTARVANAAQSGLPRATGAVAVDGTAQIATITVSWTPPTGIARQYTTQVRLN